MEADDDNSGSSSIDTRASAGASAVPQTAGSVLAKADSPPQPKDKLDEDSRKVDLERKTADLKLSKVVGYGALGFMAAQLAVADVAFFLYGESNAWQIPASAIEVWLAATVIEVIGVVLVIAKYLFPSGERSS